MKFGAASRRVLALGPGSPSTPLRCVAGVRESAVERASANSIRCFPGRMQRKRNATRDPAQELAAKRRRTHFAEPRGAPHRRIPRHPTPAAQRQSMSLVSRTRRRRLRRPCPERFVASGGASRPRRSRPQPGEAFMTQVTSRQRLSPRVRGLLCGAAAVGASRRRGRSGACRRDLPVALHGEDHRRRRTSSTSGRSASRASATAPTSSSRSTCDPGSPTYGKVDHSRSRSAGATRRTTAASPTTGATSGPAGSTTARSSSSTSRATRPSRSWSRPSTTSSRRPAAWSGRTASTRCPAAC